MLVVWGLSYKCQGQKSRFFLDGKPPTFNRNPYNGYINPYYWVDDHPLLYGNNGSLDPSTYIHLQTWSNYRESVESMKFKYVRESEPQGKFLIFWTRTSSYVRSGLNSHCFHTIGDKLICPRVGVYIPMNSEKPMGDTFPKLDDYCFWKKQPAKFIYF